MFTKKGIENATNYYCHPPPEFATESPVDGLCTKIEEDCFFFGFTLSQLLAMKMIPLQQPELI